MLDKINTLSLRCLYITFANNKTEREIVKQKTSTEKKNIKYLNDYQKIMKSNDTNFNVVIQWQEDGDTIQKYSAYDDYTPVKTSGNTTLLINE